MADKEDKSLIALKEALTNNTGIFLERATAEIILELEGFGVEREVTYSYKKSTGEDSLGTVDMMAVISVHSDSLVVCYVIECKREYAARKSWIFERDEKVIRNNLFPLFFDADFGFGKHINYGGRILLPSLGYNHDADYEQATNVFEFDNSKSQKDSLKGSKPFSALTSANAAASTLVYEPHRVKAVINSSVNRILYVPIVVTTAKLYIAEYDHKQINLGQGSISPEELTLKERPWVEYLYPLPVELKVTGGMKSGSTTNVGINPDKRSTFVVSANSIKDFVNKYADDADSYFHVAE